MIIKTVLSGFICWLVAGQLNNGRS